MRRALLALAAVATVLMATATAVADPPGPVGTGDPVINLAGGFTYTIISTGCTDSVTSTESGGTFPMPEDFDGNVVFSAGDETWLISNHELTQPRPGDFQGEVWVLPRGETGAENLELFATLPNRFEPTGMWFSNDSRIMYLSVQADPPFQSRVIAIQRTGGNFNQPYDH